MIVMPEVVQSHVGGGTQDLHDLILSSVEVSFFYE